MKLKWISIIGSMVFLGLSFYYTFAVHNGFNESIDFAGGIKLEIKGNQFVSVNSIRDFLTSEKIPADVRSAGKESGKLIKIEINGIQEIRLTEAAEKSRDSLEKMEFAINSVDYLRMRMIEKIGKNEKENVIIESASHVGPTVGKYLRVSALNVLAIALGLITIYIAFRFRLNFAVGALLASLHDLFLTFGIIGVLQIPLSVPVVAALLTILGYSINDTIVIFDRIRENMHGNPDVAVERLVDKSIWQSMTRTINTTTTTLLAILPVYFFGGEGLLELSQVLIIGILIGTYSSNFVAAPIVVIWDQFLVRKGK
ncbi:MAG: protein translocase subunit SecF [Leptospiraceae bacterium]|nr:protein translocase subunit SecF [Leptospiraceae bacterium]